MWSNISSGWFGLPYFSIYEGEAKSVLGFWASFLAIKDESFITAMRIAKSILFSIRSTYSSEMIISISISGYRSENKGKCGATCLYENVAGAVILKWPLGALVALETAASASSTSPTILLALSRYAKPTSVKDTDLVVLFNSLAPNLSSNAEMFFEITEGDKSSSLPALANDLLSAIDTKILIPVIKSINRPFNK